MTHQTNSGNGHAMPLAETISSGTIDAIADVLHHGFTALCECGLDAGKDSLVVDVYTQVILGIAKVINAGNPAFDSKKFLVRVWESKASNKTVVIEVPDEVGNQREPRSPDDAYGLED